MDPKEKIEILKQELSNPELSDKERQIILATLTRLEKDNALKTIRESNEGLDNIQQINS